MFDVIRTSGSNVSAFVVSKSAFSVPASSYRPLRQPHQSRLHAEEPKRTTLTSQHCKKWASSLSTRNNQDKQQLKLHYRLNQEITACQTAKELLQKLQTSKALIKIGGGGTLNTINFSTCSHRLGRFSSYDPSVRASTVADARFLLFCWLPWEKLS